MAIWIRFDGIRALFEVNQWFAIGSAIFYFLLFGLTEGALRQSLSVYNAIASRLGMPRVTAFNTRTR